MRKLKQVKRGNVGVKKLFTSTLALSLMLPVNIYAQEVSPEEIMENLQQTEIENNNDPYQTTLTDEEITKAFTAEELGESENTQEKTLVETLGESKGDSIIINEEITNSFTTEEPLTEEPLIDEPNDKVIEEEKIEEGIEIFEEKVSLTEFELFSSNTLIANSYEELVEIVGEAIKDLELEFTVQLGKDFDYSEYGFYSLPYDIRSDLTEIDDFYRALWFKIYLKDYGKNQLTFEIQYWEFTDEQINELRDYVISKGEYILQTAKNDYEKVLLTNNIVVDDTKYSFDSRTTPHQPYSIVDEGVGVCQAYTLMTYLILDYVGIKNIYVRGQLSSGSHAWNLVQLNGNWYHLDTTINDNDLDFYSYGYFLVSNEVINDDRKWVESDYPKANDNKYDKLKNADYAVSRNSDIYYTSFEDEAIYGINLITGESELIFKGRNYSLEIFGNELYFVNFEDYGTLYSISIDNKELKKLNNINTVGFEIIDGILIYETYKGDKQQIVLGNEIKENVVQEVIKEINVINIYNKNFREQVNEVRNLYNRLSDSEKSKVTNYDKLVQFEKYISDFEKEKQTHQIWEHLTTEETNKTWSINFNMEIDESTLKDSIRVNLNGQDIPVKVSLTDNKKSILVEPPKEGYKKGLMYNIYITQDLKSTNGKSMTKPFRFDFTVE